jgi:hypothetical protein
MTVTLNLPFYHAILLFPAQEACLQTVFLGAEFRNWEEDPVVFIDKPYQERNHCSAVFE